MERVELGGLATGYLGRRHLHLEEVDSTNNYCKENAASLPHGAAVTARVQTGGKGRLGRSWGDVTDKGLALSVLLHGWTPGEMAVLPLLAGVAVCQGLEALCGARCQVKWSNDILLEEKKVCGILCESRLSSTGGAAVIGMGVNVLQDGEDFRRLGLVYANSLFLVTGKKYELSAVAAGILNHLEPVLEKYRREGFSPLRARYKSRCVNLGRPVRVLLDGGEQQGVARDIGEDGSLLCEIGGELRAVNAGEASVRGIYGYV